MENPLDKRYSSTVTPVKLRTQGSGIADLNIGAHRKSSGGLLQAQAASHSTGWGNQGVLFRARAQLMWALLVQEPHSAEIPPSHLEREGKTRKPQLLFRLVLHSLAKVQGQTQASWRAALGRTLLDGGVSWGCGDSCLPNKQKGLNPQAEFRAGPPV